MGMNNSRILGVVVLVGLLAGVAPYVWRHLPDWLASPPSSSPASTVQMPPAAAASTTTPAERAAKPAPGAPAAPGPTRAGDMPMASSDEPAIDGTGRRSSGASGGSAGATAGGGRANATGSRPPSNLYLAANAATWTRLDVAIDGPTRIRTGGEMAVGPSVIGASGFHAIVRQEDLVLPAAPYLSVIGRLCGPDGCSKPFAVGAGTLVCPSQIGSTGTLELWTNNFRGTRVAESRTVYSQASGGFYVYASPAAADACGRDAGARPGGDVAALSEGTTLARPEFVVSSRQGAWKPFFVPLGGALRFQATGQVRPSGNLRATGPEGIAVTDPTWWSYPGTSAIVVDVSHPLYVPDVPYQALIGRVCGASNCGAPFFIGRERTICAAEDLQDRLEVWINNTVAPKGMMEQRMPLTLQVFDLQARTGEYRFSLTGASRAACGNGAAGSR
jgi:hypothetical protein